MDEKNGKNVVQKLLCEFWGLIDYVIREFPSQKLNRRLEINGSSSKLVAEEKSSKFLFAWGHNFQR